MEPWNLFALKLHVWSVVSNTCASGRSGVIAALVSLRSTVLAEYTVGSKNSKLSHFGKVCKTYQFVFQSQNIILYAGISWNCKRSGFLARKLAVYFCRQKLEFHYFRTVYTFFIYSLLGSQNSEISNSQNSYSGIDYYKYMYILWIANSSIAIRILTAENSVDGETFFGANVHCDSR